jgi:hypothetical protein
MKLSPASYYYYFSLLRSKYSPQYPVLKHAPSVFSPQCERPSFRSIRNYRLNCNLFYFSPYVFGNKREDIRLWTE